MGQHASVFETEQIEQYSECTFFTRKDILRLYKRFSQLNPVKINSRIADVCTRLTFDEVLQIPELRVNPFKDRICEVFSTDGYGINFEDFLDLFSVFSERAPWDLKATYAFRIFDFDGDSVICREDIEQVLRSLTGTSLAPSEVENIINGVIQEADIAKTERLTYTEFEHFISRAPDFVNLFHITI